jgi:hypothetical protein
LGILERTRPVIGKSRPVPFQWNFVQILDNSRKNNPKIVGSKF